MLRRSVCQCWFAHFQWCDPCSWDKRSAANNGLLSHNAEMLRNDVCQYWLVCLVCLEAHLQCWEYQLEMLRCSLMLRHGVCQYRFAHLHILFIFLVQMNTMFRWAQCWLLRCWDTVSANIGLPTCASVRRRRLPWCQQTHRSDNRLFWQLDSIQTHKSTKQREGGGNKHQD